MKTRTLTLERVALAALAIGLAGCATKATSRPVSGAMVGDRPVDAVLAQRGAEVWRSKSCYTCHQFGKRVAGPDLLGIMDRRDHTWLRAWLMRTDSMLASDAQAEAMLKEWKGVKMPNMKLQATDVDALFHFMAQESARARSTGS
jgi:cytochrome c551/c552